MADIVYLQSGSAGNFDWGSVVLGKGIRRKERVSEHIK